MDSKIVWSDFDAEFNKGLNSDIVYFRNVNSIKQSIKNILNTPKGRDLMDPSFGTNLYLYQFDMLDDITIDFLKEIVKNDITSFEPRVIVKTVDIKKTNDTSIHVTIVFSVKETKLEDSMNYEVQL